MRRLLVWFLNAQKFLFGFAVIFGAIPITYAISDILFDNNFLIFLLGIIIYVLCVIPLAYALGTGYDRLIQRAGTKEELRSKNSTIAAKETELSLNIQEDDSELTVIEKKL